MPAKWWVVAVAALVLGASALFGGLDDANVTSAELPELSPGEPFIAEELTTTVTDARLADSLPDSFSEPDDGYRFLIVTATIINNFRNSTQALDDVLALDVVADDDDYRDPRVLLESDGTGLPQAVPRVPVDVIYVWQVPIGRVEAGDVVRVSVTSRSYFTQNSVTYGDRWQDPVTAATIDLEVTE